MLFRKILTIVHLNSKLWNELVPIPSSCGSSGAVRFSSRAVRLFLALLGRGVRPSYGTFFHMVFQGNCARVRTGHMIKNIIRLNGMFFKIFSFIFCARTIKPVLTFEYFAGSVFSKLKLRGRLHEPGWFGRRAGSVCRNDCSARYYMRRASPPAAKFRSCRVKRWLHRRAISA